VIPDDVHTQVMQLKLESGIIDKCFVCSQKMKYKRLGLCATCYRRLVSSGSVYYLLHSNKWQEDKKNRNKSLLLRSGLANNLLSFYGKKYGEAFVFDLKRMKWNCLLTLASLSKKYGYTLEFMRQMYVAICGEDYSIAKADKAKEKFEYRKGVSFPDKAYLREALRLMAEAGLEVMRVNQSTKIYIVNGFLTCVTKRKTFGLGKYYSNIKRSNVYSRNPVDATVVYLTEDKGFHVILWPRRQMSYYAKKGKEKLNNWHVFKRKCDKRWTPEMLQNPKKVK